jgi:hypothetical protein
MIAPWNYVAVLLLNNHRMMPIAIKPTRPPSPSCWIILIKLPTILAKKVTFEPKRIWARMPIATSINPNSIIWPSHCLTVVSIYVSLSAEQTERTNFPAPSVLDPTLLCVVSCLCITSKYHRLWLTGNNPTTYRKGCQV